VIDTLRQHLKEANEASVVARRARAEWFVIAFDLAVILRAERPHDPISGTRGIAYGVLGKWEETVPKVDPPIDPPGYRALCNFLYDCTNGGSLKPKTKSSKKKS
jgi:hypothetical protein